MKILTEKYPIGTIPNQQTAGRYIDGTLYENLKVLAQNIIKDQTWLGIVSSSTLEVGTGKSTFVQQMGEAYLECIRQIHGINIQLSMENIVWKPKDLIERSFKVPKYSFIILDEWEDANYWSELGMTLRQFFRKCRQLNLFIIIIIPNFFQLPINYAVSRSVFFIDVHFANNFERGYFRFYNFQKKKDLYLLGKKTHNYNVVRPNFIGRFLDGYVVDDKEYREAKRNDMIKEEDELKKPTEQQIKIRFFKQVYESFKNNPKIKGFNMNCLSKAFGISERTASRWMKNDFSDESYEIIQDTGSDIDNSPSIKKT